MESILGSKVEVETKLKAVFLPFISKSHLIFVVDIARLFAIHGVDVTIITTPSNASIFQSSIDRDSSRNNRSIRTHIVKFPQVPGLPQGMESFNADTPNEIRPKIYQGLFILQEEFKQIFRDMKPDFIVTDMFYPWTVDVADELEIPRLVCVGGSYFAHSAINSLQQFEPHKKVNSNREKFVLPGLPDELEMTCLQLPDWIREPNDYGYLMKMIKDSEKKSYGSIFDTYYEIEGRYEEHYKNAMGTKSWSVGPVSLWVNQDDSYKVGRGGGKENDGSEKVLNWLNSKTEDSVLYVSFGSMNKFPTLQLVEIAHALEDSGHDFIWVVRKIEDDDKNGVFLKEFEKRMKEEKRGYLIYGWAPQLVILEHVAIGGVVTHCGWNTIMESVNAGLPLATWPLFAEQFFNEKLVVDVLKIGVGVGAKEWRNWNEFGGEDDVVKREDIGKAIGLLMGSGEESLEMRKRVKALSCDAKKTIMVGGSSHTKLKELIEELKLFKLAKGVGSVA